MWRNKLRYQRSKVCKTIDKGWTRVASELTRVLNITLITYSRVTGRRMYAPAHARAGVATGAIVWMPRCGLSERALLLENNGWNDNSWFISWRKNKARWRTRTWIFIEIPASNNCPVSQQRVAAVYTDRQTAIAVHVKHNHAPYVYVEARSTSFLSVNLC